MNNDEQKLFPPVPIYVEKYTSFYTRKNPTKLISKFLDELKLPHEFKRVKGKFTHTGADPVLPPRPIGSQPYPEEWSKGEVTDARIYLYEADEGILCEFQRRSGNTVVFNNIYRKIIEKLSKEGVVILPYMAK